MKLVQVSIGIAYAGLAEVRDKEANLGLAITAYKESQKIYTKNEYPEKYKIITEIIMKMKEIISRKD